MKIGIISDTHGFLDERLLEQMADCDELWHAGDVGHIEVLHKLMDFKPLRCVYGNIDDRNIRLQTQENLIFELQGCKVLITHIAGKPPRYNSRVINLLRCEQPRILVCGHSHIPMAMHDEKHNLMVLNPGAAGHEGFHHQRTAMRLQLIDGQITNLALLELGKRGRIHQTENPTHLHQNLLR